MTFILQFTDIFGKQQEQVFLSEEQARSAARQLRRCGYTDVELETHYSSQEEAPAT